ncbi:MAG: ABC transporter permease [Kiritimatiellae bacterium]|nr:ABC transporter permease [Kiritimatiellia bacterium]
MHRVKFILWNKSVNRMPRFDHFGSMQGRLFLLRAFLTFCILPFAFRISSSAAQPWATPEDAASALRDLQTFLQDADVRAPGSPGNLAMEEKVARAFAATGLEHGAINFTAPVFIPGKTTITPEGQAPLAIFPMHPTLFRPGNFAEKDFSARLVYLGRGTAADLDKAKGTRLGGALALLDFDCGQDWMALLRFGLKGFVFIAPECYTKFDAIGKINASEVAVPRFLADSKEGAILKAAALSTSVVVRVQAEPSRWENRILRNPWVLIPGRDTDLAREVSVIVAPIDTSGVVPDQARGAQAGANLFLLMRLLEQFQKEPPSRSVLLAAVNAHTQNFRGERMLAWYLMADDTESVRNLLTADRHMAQLLLDHYRQLKLDSFRPEDEALLIKWRSLVDSSAVKNVTVKNPLVTLAKRDVNRFKNDQLRLIQKNLPKAEHAAQSKALAAQQAFYVHVLTLFNKVGIRTKLSDLTPDEVKILKGYVREVITANQTILDLNQEDLARDQDNERIRTVMQSRSIPFVILLDLNWGSPNLAFGSGNGNGFVLTRWSARWGDNTARIAAELPAVQANEHPNRMVDAITMRGGLPEAYYFSVHPSPSTSASTILRRPVETYFTAAGRVPVFPLKNAFSGIGADVRFLPSDTLAQISPSNLAENTAFASSLLRAVLDDPGITTSSELGTTDLKYKYQFGSLRVKTYKFDELSASVFPDIPVPNCAVIRRPENPLAILEPLNKDVLVNDVIIADLALTDRRATTIIYSTILTMPDDTVSAFHFDKDFTRVDFAIDAGDVYRKVKPAAYDKSMTLALFECFELPFYSTADSSLVSDFPIAMDRIMPVTARGNSSPRKYGITGLAPQTSLKKINATAGAPAAFYVNPSQRIKLVSSEKRLALNATEKDPEGRGFASAAELGADVFARITRDMATLNHARAAKVKVLVNDLIREFIQRGDDCLKRMDECAAQNDHLGYVRAQYEALGAHVKSYEQAKQTRDDMLQAVVVYMALLLPFCLFLEKLLFRFVKIEHEMGMFGVLFVITFIIFRAIHPAFRVAQAAETIFIAFIMGALGVFVISILHSRFEGTMQLLFRSYLGNEVGYSTVTQKAMLIGVNNMKRRRVRTMLTTATIVLVAFTMLSFTSISKKVNPTLVTKSKTAPYTGFMYHWPGKYPMDEQTLAVFNTMFEKRGTIIVRRWLLADEGAPFAAMCNLGTQAQMEGILGLPCAEDGFLARIPLVSGRFFSSDEADEAILSSAAAQVLHIDPDVIQAVTISFQGKTFKVVGIFDDVQFRNMKDLNGLPLTPILKLVADGADQGMAQARQQSTSGSKQGKDMQDIGNLFFTDPAALMVIPLQTAKKLGAQPYSISLKMKDNEPIWPMADLLLTTTQARFYMSSRIPFVPSLRSERQTVAPGAYFIGSSYSTSVGGLSALLIPLFIAGTIILNTMLGSVYERKKEIAVYNAIGLNPHHIGTFFLAESFVYGVIGSVGGYLIGQVLSLAVSYTGLVQGINFNYSSLSVAYVILLTIAIVLLSTLYPAMAATKAAVPSGKRTWSLPKHDGRTMPVLFPFIYQPRIAIGVMAYLQEYFGRYTEASIGDMIATEEGRSHDVDAKGRDRHTLTYHAALVPYDLGVTEHLVFNLAYDDHVQAYCLHLNINRISGQDSNWVTTNRPFLENLRKYLMRWRNLDAAQQNFYIQQAGKEFLNA